jgi:endoglucanase
MPAEAPSISLNMRRRLFITSSSAAIALSLVGCGGGGGGGTDSSAASSALASDTGFPITSGSAARAGSGYPFGARLDRYVAGILPTNASNAQMDSAIASCYDAWKARAIVDVPTVPGGKCVKFSESTTYLTVSEGQGYGMLITVLMAGHDPQAKAIFDALFTTVRARPAKGGLPQSPLAKYLMDWRLMMDGTTSDDHDTAANAVDGDLDVAMALLMANRQWGSTGAVNYQQEALNTIAAIKFFHMQPSGSIRSGPTIDTSRTSDYMIGHFRQFAKATNDSYWSTLAIDKAYALTERMQTVYSPGVGLVPDWIIDATGNAAQPSPGGRGDFTDTEGFFAGNAQRDPWRFGTDYVLSGDTRWKDVCNKMVNFMKADCRGDPAQIADGYHLDGSVMERRFPPKGIIGPLLCGAMVDPAHQEFLNTLWSWTVNNFSTDYYDAELMLIPMIVASGNWWNP